jgi:acetyl esterase/lipase
MSRVRSRPTGIIYWLVLLISAALLFATVWIVVPAPNQLLLALGVAAPELSPVLFAISLIAILVTLPYGRDLGTARLALVFSLVSAAVSLAPLVQVSSTVKRFDAAMNRAGIPVNGAPIRYGEIFQLPRTLPLHVVRGVKMTTVAGAPLTVDIYRPPSGSGPFPIIVQVYGGAWQRGSPADYAWFAQYFASRGYIIVAADYRHAPSSTWPRQFEDVSGVLHWTLAHAATFNGDSKRVVILGRSSGAQLAMTVAFREPVGTVRGVVSLYGPVDLAEGWRHPPDPDPLKVREILETYLGGSPAQVPERYREASPVTYVRRDVPPTLLIYGAKDHIVEPRFGAELHRTLQQAGAQSVLLDIPWSEHAFDIIPNGLGGQLALHYIEAFIRWAVR